MTQQTRTSIHLAFWGLAALDFGIIVLGLVFVIVPDVRSWSRAAAEVTVVRAARVDVEKALAPFEESRDGDAEQLSLMRRLDAVFPEDANLAGLYDEVAELVQRSGMALSGIDVAEVAAEGTKGFRRIQITVRVDGFTYPTLKRFVELVERAPHLYDLRSVALSREAPQATLTLWTYAFTPSNE